MACFTVPLATAVVTSAAKNALPESTRKNPFVAKLGWLGKMMFGGSFPLAIEHVYHGEIVFTPPFLTAVKNGETADMLHEMARSTGGAEEAGCVVLRVGLRAKQRPCPPILFR